MAVASRRTPRSTGAQRTEEKPRTEDEFMAWFESMKASHEEASGIPLASAPVRMRVGAFVIAGLLFLIAFGAGFGAAFAIGEGAFSAFARSVGERVRAGEFLVIVSVILAFLVALLAPLAAILVLYAERQRRDQVRRIGEWNERPLVVLPPLGVSLPASAIVPGPQITSKVAPPGT